MLRSWMTLASFLAMALGHPAQVRAQEQWKLGSLMQPPSFGATLDDEVLRAVAKSSGGKLTAERQFVANEQEMVQQVVRGRLQMGATSAFGAGVTVPDATVVSLPYIWSSDAERRYVTDKFVFPFLERLFADKGLELLAIQRGRLQRRVLQGACNSPPASRASRRASRRRQHRGCSGSRWAPTACRFRSANCGRGSSRTSSWPATCRFPFYSTTPGAKSAPNFVATQHLHHPWIYFVNKALWDALPGRPAQGDHRRVAAVQPVRDAWFADEKKKLDAFATSGGKITILSDAERAQWQKLVEPGLAVS